MIVELFIYAIGVILGFFGQFFPSDPSCGCVTTLPWGLEGILTQGVNGYKVLAESFPPFGIVFNAFLILLSFKIALKLLKGVPILGRTLD